MSIAEEILMHYGMPRRSGRYPWGSGEDPYQHSMDFLGKVEKLRKTGFVYTDEKTGKKYTGDMAIAKALNMSSTQFRTEVALAKDQRRMYRVARAKSLKEDGLNDSEIGREMGVNESTVRSWLNAESESRMKRAMETANFLKAEVDKKGMVDVGVGVEREINISKEKMDQALALLQREGYEVYSGRFEQVNNRGKMTTQKVLCVPGTKHSEIYDLDRVHSLKDYISRDGGESFEKKFHYPESMDSKRMMIRYKEDGGIDKDGIIELRRGVADLSLGESRYSQVRILVDGTHYLKGMAVYSDDMPAGVDVIFNTNKKAGTPQGDVLKKIKNDPDNPFGSAIKDADQGGQYWYDPKTGQKVSSKTPGAKLGLINKRADEGDWDDWSDTLPSQFLSKQSKTMVKKQLGLAKDDKLAEYEAICSLTNPTLKKHYLQEFADSCDAAAVNLKAAALPGQKYHVIVPINTLKETEVYAPGYDNGTKLALIRYPHGGTFEIPILTVNNKNQLGKKIIGTDAIDGVGINSKVAERLSGADFDGDTVMCIPTHDSAGKVKIKSTPPLKGLEGFDPKDKYQYDTKEVDKDGVEHYYKNGKEFKVMKNTGTQMGIISNLITDMTLSGGATQEELARAVRHSMVVIDAEKHKLDYKQSEMDNNIAALHEKYQGKKSGGAATIISKAKGETSVDKRQGSPIINIKGSKDYDPSKPEGALIYKKADDLYYAEKKYDKDTGIMTVRTSTGKSIKYDVRDPEAKAKYEPVENGTTPDGKTRYTNRDGSIEYRTGTRKQQSTKMAEAEDAYELVSEARHVVELYYADYANDMKALANRARVEMANTGKIAYSASAKTTYAQEVRDLDDKLNNALLNAGREREAQRRANVEVEQKKAKAKAEGTELKTSEIKKASQQALSKYRNEVNSVARRDRSIIITDKEWEAIQAGAISENKLKKILNNTDPDNLRQKAMPKAGNKLSTAQVNRIRSMSASNYSIKEIANKLGISTSAVAEYLKGGK